MAKWPTAKPSPCRVWCTCCPSCSQTLFPIQKQNRARPRRSIFEDRIARAVRRMFEGRRRGACRLPASASSTSPLATRPFIHTQPLGKTAGLAVVEIPRAFLRQRRYPDAIDIALSRTDYLALTDPKRSSMCSKCIQAQLSGRRICPRQNPSMPSRSAQPTDSGGTYPGAADGFAAGAALFSRRTAGMDSAAQSSRKSCSPAVGSCIARRCWTTKPSINWMAGLQRRGNKSPGIAIKLALCRKPSIREAPAMPPPLPRAAQRAFMKCWMLYAGTRKQHSAGVGFRTHQKRYWFMVPSRMMTPARPSLPR